MAFTPPIGSIIAFQSDPTKLVGTVSVVGTLPVVLNNSSIISVNQGSVATVIIGGSIAASFTPPANQSISGTVQTDVRGSVAVAIISGSVVATQGITPWQIVSSLAGGIFPISGSVGAVIMNTPNVNTAGSVVAFQGTSPWISNFQNSSILAVPVGSTIGVQQGSVAVAIISGSIAATFTPPANQSVSGTVQTNLLSSNASVITVGQGSIAVNIISGSIAASFTPPANQSVSGTVGASIIGTAPVTQGGTWTASVFGNMSVIGTVPVTQSGPWTQSVVGTYPDSFVASTVTGIPIMFKANISSSIMQAVSPTFPLPIVGSVSGAVGITGNPSISGTVNIGVIPGSVVAFQGGAQITSIVGAFAEDSAHSAGDIGVFSMGVRNDTLSSVTNADVDYTRITVGPTGETIIANAPITKWVQGTISVLNQFGVSMTTIAAQGSSIFTYITGVQIANMSASSVLVTLSGATSSVIAYSIAPPGGGSNIVYPNPIKTNANGAFTASVSGATSVYLSAQGFISKT